MKKQRGFTLIELVMVIGIVAMMLGALLPALSEARLAAESTVDKAQQRQLGVAILAYAEDNNGYAPGMTPCLSGPDVPGLFKQGTKWDIAVDEFGAGIAYRDIWGLTGGAHGSTPMQLGLGVLLQPGSACRTVVGNPGWWGNYYDLDLMWTPAEQQYSTVTNGFEHHTYWYTRQYFGEPESVPWIHPDTGLYWAYWFSGSNYDQGTSYHYRGTDYCEVRQVGTPVYHTIFDNMDGSGNTVYMYGNLTTRDEIVQSWANVKVESLDWSTKSIAMTHSLWALDPTNPGCNVTMGDGSVSFENDGAWVSDVAGNVTKNWWWGGWGTPGSRYFATLDYYKDN